jgi:hypothetical protein
MCCWNFAGVRMSDAKIRNAGADYDRENLDLRGASWRTRKMST